jgi:hypothetical protein
MLPLFTATFPSNTIYFYSRIIEISNFDILPTDKMLTITRIKFDDNNMVPFNT